MLENFGHSTRRLNFFQLFINNLKSLEIFPDHFLNRMNPDRRPPFRGRSSSSVEIGRSIHKPWFSGLYALCVERRDKWGPRLPHGKRIKSKPIIRNGGSEACLERKDVGKRRNEDEQRVTPGGGVRSSQSHPSDPYSLYQRHVWILDILDTLEQVKAERRNEDRLRETPRGEFVVVGPILVTHIHSSS